MSKELESGLQSKRLSRRAINKGLVWTAPAVVAAAAAPRIAASEGVLWRATLQASGTTLAAGTLVLPTDATDVTYTVVGGGGGGSTNGTGGGGHQINGSLLDGALQGST